MTLAEQDASDLLEMIADLPVAMTFGDNTSNVISGDAAESGSLGFEGMDIDYDRFFVVPFALFSTMPGIAEKVTAEGKDYIVVRFQDSPGNVSRTLYCTSKEG